MRSFLLKNIYLLLASVWLITIAIVIDNYWSAGASQKTVQNKLTYDIQKQERDFQVLVADPAVIKKVKENKYDELFLNELVKKDYFVFFYNYDTAHQMHLHSWNTQQIQPSSALLFMDGNAGFVQLANGYYVWNSYNLQGLKAIALIPVKWNYYISNQYLRNNFSDNSVPPTYEITSRANTHQPVKSLHGDILFYIDEIAPGVIHKNNVLSVWLIVAAILLLLFILHLVAAEIIKRKGVYKGILFLLLVVSVLRVTTYYFHIPFDVRQFELFDPSIYGSGRFMESLGDLLINSVLFVWLVFFIRHHIQESGLRFNIRPGIMQYFLTAVGGLIFMLLTFGGNYVVRSLIADSNISFDVINFFSLNIYSIVGFIVLCCIAIGYYFLCQIILFLLRPVFPGKPWPLFGFIALAGMIFLSARLGSPNWINYLVVLAWLLFFLFLLNNTVLNLIASRIVSSKLVFWLFFFSLSITAVIIGENDRKDKEKRRHYAELIATKSDPVNETLLNTLLTDFNPTYLGSVFGRFKDSIDNRSLKDSLLNQSSTAFNEKYDTKILVFEAGGKSLFNSDSVTLNELNTILYTQAKKTAKPGLYYYDESFDRFSYISKIDVINYDTSKGGYVFIISSPRRFRTEALYPELFGRGRTNAIENSSLYAIGVYKDRKLISSGADYPFPSELEMSKIPPPEFRDTIIRNYTELWYYAGSGRMIVIARENRVALESITLFSYIFCSFLLLTAIFWLLNNQIKTLLKRGSSKELWQFNIRSQIHGTVILVSVVSFAVIGLATILFFINRYDDSNREMLNRTLKIMEHELHASLYPSMANRDSLAQFPTVYATLKKEVDAISNAHRTDFNIYNLNGDLLISSLNWPFEKGIITDKMDPMAFFHLHNLNEVQYYQKEKISKLSYSSNYIPLVDESGNKYAYLNIPYYTSGEGLKQEISNFLVTIINLNAFIFLIAGIVALFITNRITGSFSMIANKMKKVNLGSRNEPIEWHRNDEIGALVFEYNKMVNKLDESAESLAKNEREGAWREMARQIAHEIKNPLTPMKLSMQYLQRAIDNNDPNIKQLSTDVAHTLIEQIDHLSHIANEFNQFANIENARLEEIDINATLKSVINLFNLGNNTDLEIALLNQPVKIIADKTHINRVFTNLIQNAVQSVPEGRLPRISVREEIMDDKVIIQIADNGTGIHEDLQPFIFTPNFTTKMSGTGLGLAMCKRMVEQAGGTISFSTRIGEGTTFRIEFPLIVYSDAL